MNTGKLELILGPMWAGKTGELLRRIGRYKFCNKNILLIKHGKDTRYDNNEEEEEEEEECESTTIITHIHTHDGIKHEAISLDSLENDKLTSEQKSKI